MAIIATLKTGTTLALWGGGIVEVHDAATGELLHREEYTNVITNYARAELMQSFKGIVADVGVTHVAVGSDGTAALPTDTALGNEVVRQVPTTVVDYSATEIGWKLFLSASVGNGTTFREIGLFNAASGGDMMARSVSFTPIAKNSSITITFTHILRYQL